MTNSLIKADNNEKKFTQNEVWIRISAFLSLKTPNTQNTYVGIIREWVEFLGAKIGTPEGARAVLNAKDLHAIAYKRFLDKKQGQRPRVETSENQKEVSTFVRPKTKNTGTFNTLTNSTISKKFTALRRIYRMLIAASLCKENPFDIDKVHVTSGKSGQKRPTEMIDFDIVTKIINSPDEKTLKGLRDKTILSLLFAGGLRRSEVANLIIDDVKESQEGTLFLKLRATKSGKDATQALPLWCSSILFKYLNIRLNEGALSGDKLFMGTLGKDKSNSVPLTTSGIYRLFKKYCLQAGAGAYVSPHSARATAITKLLSDGLSHREVQEFSRHASIQMVEAYDKRLFGVEKNPGKNLKY